MGPAQGLLPAAASPHHTKGLSPFMMWKLTSFTASHGPDFIPFPKNIPLQVGLSRLPTSLSSFIPSVHVSVRILCHT